MSEQVYEETIEITPEVFYVLKHSKKLNEEIHKSATTYEFISETSPYSIVLRSNEGKECVDKIKSRFFDDQSKFLSIKFRDYEMKIMFGSSYMDRSFDDKYYPYELESYAIKEMKSSESIYGFILNKDITDDYFEGRHVFIIHVNDKQLKSYYYTTDQSCKIANYRVAVFKRGAGSICEEFESIMNEDGKIRYEFINSEYKRYLNIGKHVLEYKETKNLLKLIKSIQNKKSFFDDINDKPFQYVDGHIPYLFICESSGSGKTQLPFSLDIPLIYFLNNRKLLFRDVEFSGTLQTIYQPFEMMSKCFYSCVLRDIEILRIKDSDVGSLHENIDEKELLHLPFYMVYLLKSIVKIRKNGHEDEPWTTSQLRVGTSYLIIERMSILEAREAISDLFRDSVKPVIFLDESQAMFNDKILIEISYIRTIIRKFDLMPIFSTTDAGMGHVLSFKTEEKEYDYPTYYVIHKLAPMATAYLDSQLQIYKEIILSKAEPDVKFTVERAFSYFKNEKPFFFELFDFLHEMIIGKSNLGQEVKVKIPFDRLIFFQMITVALFETYTGRKTMFKNFKFEKSKIHQVNYNYLNLLIPGLFEDKLFNFDYKGPKSIDHLRAGGIHNHIARLYVPDNISKMNEGLDVVPLVLSGNDMLAYSLKNNEIGPRYTFQQTFKPFESEVIGDLMFTHPRGIYRTFFRTSDVESTGGDYSSVISAVNQLGSKFNIFPDIPLNQIIEWNTLKLASVASSIVAGTRCKLVGQSFEKWLTHFIEAMTYDDKVECIANYNMNFTPPDDIFKHFLGKKMPMCSSRANNRWGHYDDLVNDGADLGVVFSDLERMDFYIKRMCSLTTYETLISGLCVDKKIDPSVIDDFMNNINNSGLKNHIILFIIEENTSAVEIIYDKCSSKNLAVYKLKRADDINLKSTEFKSQPMNFELSVHKKSSCDISDVNIAIIFEIIDAPVD